MTEPRDEEEPSFDATPRKLEQAREKGEVARSPDLDAAASYLGLLIVLTLAGATLLQSSANSLLGFFRMSEAASGPELAQSMAPIILSATVEALLPIAAVLLAPLVAVVAIVFVQNAWVFAPTRLKPQLSRVSPLSNAKHKFGRTGLFEFAKSAVKLTVLSFGLSLFLVQNFDDVLGSLQAPPIFVFGLMVRLALDFLLVVVGIAGAIAAIDWLWQVNDHLRRNRMTRKELLDEAKDSEGDPYLKSARRQKGMAIASNHMLAEVPKSDVIIVNPTHFAVALSWSRLPGTAPMCIAKGTDHLAARIRQAAEDAGIPIYSDPPTARGLFASVEIGQQIDPKFYRAVATAIRFSDRMRQRAKGTRL